MNVRGKFQLRESTDLSWSTTVKRFLFDAVCDDGTEENARFARATPMPSSITMTVDNPTAAAQFELGKFYFVDFTEAA